MRGTSVPCRPRNAAAGSTTPGRRLCRERLESSNWCVNTPPACGLRWHGTWRGHGPPEGTACPGPGDHDLSGLCALALRWRYRVQSRTGAFPLIAWRAVGRFARRRCRGPRPGLETGTPRRLRRGHDGPEPCPSWSCCLADDAAHSRLCGVTPDHASASGVIAARQVAACRPPWAPRRCTGRPAGLARLDPGLEAPGLHLLAACGFETRQAVGLCGAGLDVCLDDHGLRRGGQTTALRQRRGAGRPWARPVERIACRSPQALRRNVAACRARRVSSRARRRSRRAASSPAGPDPGLRSPERLAAPIAWRHAARLGPGRPALGASRRGRRPRRRSLCSSASERARSRRGPRRDEDACRPLDGRVRSSWSIAHGRVPMVPRATTAAPCAVAPRRPRWTPDDIHATVERAATVPGLTSASVACLWATGGGSGFGQRPRDALGVSLPIGSHYV